MTTLTAFFASHWVLDILLALPLVGAALCMAVSENRAKHVAMATATLEFAISLPLFWTFRTGTAALQNYASIPWIETWGIGYRVGIDGISLLMVLLTTLTMPLAVLSSYRYIRRHVRAFYAMLLILLTGMLGVFVSFDLFLFYVSWEIMLIPMYFLIGVWGGERRIYSAIKFFLFTAIGSLLMLVAIVTMVMLYHRQYGVVTFDYNELVQLPIGRNLQFWLFGAFALAFAIKVPMFPLHTWLPDAHVEAPTAGSVILAGILLKTGAYGFLRFALPFFSFAATSPVVVNTALTLCVVGILYGAWVATVQPDAKKLVAYTSIAHLGFVMLGIFALTSVGLQGAIMQMVNHGISTGALFLLVGMMYERRHTRLIADYGGIARVMPMFAAALMLVALSSIGLPGTNGFVGEFLILVGSFESHPIAAFLAAIGVIFAACYMLPMLQRVLFGEVTSDKNRGLKDLSGRERLVLAPLLTAILLLGIYPQPFLARTAASVEALRTEVEKRTREAPVGMGGNTLRFDPMPVADATLGGRR